MRWIQRPAGDNGPRLVGGFKEFVHKYASFAMEYMQNEVPSVSEIRVRMTSIQWRSPRKRPSLPPTASGHAAGAPKKGANNKGRRGTAGCRWRYARVPDPTDWRNLQGLLVSRAVLGTRDLASLTVA